MRNDRLYCPVCSDVIGVYEPAVVIDPSQVRVTSLAREPTLHRGEHIVMHRQCALADGWDSLDA